MGRREALLRSKVLQLSNKFIAATPHSSSEEERTRMAEAIAKLYLELGDAASALEYLSNVDEQSLTPSGLQSKATAHYCNNEADLARSICAGLLGNARLKLIRQIEYATFGIYSRLLNNSNDSEKALSAIEEGLAHGVESGMICRQIYCGTRGALLVAGASLCRQVRRLGKALAFLEEAHRLREYCLAPYSFAQVWLEIAQVYEDCGMSVLAEGAVNVAKRMLPQGVKEGFRQLARVHFRQGDDRAGDACLRQAGIRCAPAEEGECSDGQTQDILGHWSRGEAVMLKPSLRFKRKRFEAMVMKSVCVVEKTKPARNLDPSRFRKARKRRSKRGIVKRSQEESACKATQTSLELDSPRTSISEEDLDEKRARDISNSTASEDNGKADGTVEAPLEDYSMDDFDNVLNETKKMEAREEEKEVGEVDNSQSNNKKPTTLDGVQEEHKGDGNSLISASEEESHLYNSEDERALLSPPVEMELEKMFTENPELLDTAHLFESNSIISDISFDMNKFDVDIGKGDPLFESFLFEDEEEKINMDEGQSKQMKEPASDSIEDKQTEPVAQMESKDDT